MMPTLHLRGQGGSDCGPWRRARGSGAVWWADCGRRGQPASPRRRRAPRKVPRATASGWPTDPGPAGRPRSALFAHLLRRLSHDTSITGQPVGATYAAKKHWDTDLFPGERTTPMAPDRTPGLDEQSLALISANLKCARYTPAGPSPALAVRPRSSGRWPAPLAPRSKPMPQTDQTQPGSMTILAHRARRSRPHG